jgi:hypothetical protein
MIRIVIASLIALAASVSTDEIWGGDSIEIQATAKGATVDFDCAHGTIDKPFSPDSKGHFEIAGTFTPETHGPVREDVSLTRDATYAGTIKEDAMTLRVTFTGTDAPPPLVFELVRGRPGNVRKCR